MQRLLHTAFCWVWGVFFGSRPYLFTGFHSQSSVLSVVWRCVGAKMQPLWTVCILS